MAGTIEDAINVFFDRTERMLPTYVGKGPSMLVGMAVSTIVLFLALPSVVEERKQNGSHEDNVKRLRWIVLLAVVLVSTGVVYDFVQGKVYDVMMIGANRQHVANVHWLKHYRTSVMA